MSVKRSGLGRNLSALLSQTDGSLLLPQAGALELMRLSIDVLQPGKYQPRGLIDDDSIVELSASIKKQGLFNHRVHRV